MTSVLLPPGIPGHWKLDAKIKHKHSQWLPLEYIGIHASGKSRSAWQRNMPIKKKRSKTQMILKYYQAATKN